MKKKTYQFKISIDDGFVEYRYAVQIDSKECINSVYEKIRKQFGARKTKGSIRKKYTP